MKIPKNNLSKLREEKKSSRESERASARADDDGFHLPEKGVKNRDEEFSKPAQAYVAAYKEHYTNSDLKAAFNLYRGVIAIYPESQEAMYSKKQIENIVALVVPAQEVFDAQVNMALVRFK